MRYLRARAYNHELKAVNRLIFTLTRIPKGAQKYIDDKCVYFLVSFFLLTIHGDIGVNEAHTRQLEIFDANFIVIFCLVLTGR